jgi:hypothetical protein
MGDAFAIPDIWDTIKIYDAHIQTIKNFKNDYEILLAGKHGVEAAKG